MSYVSVSIPNGPVEEQLLIQRSGDRRWLWTTAAVAAAMFLAGFVGAVGFTPTSTATAQAFLSTPSPVSTANSGAAFRAPQLTGPTGHTVARATLSEVEQQLMQHEVWLHNLPCLLSRPLPTSANPFPSPSPSPVLEGFTGMLVLHQCDLRSIPNPILEFGPPFPFPCPFENN